MLETIQCNRRVNCLDKKRFREGSTEVGIYGSRSTYLDEL